MTNTHNIGKECVLLGLISGYRKAPQQLICFQVKHQNAVRCDLLGVAQNVSQSSVQHPQAIADVDLDAERRNDGRIVVQLDTSILGLVSIQATTRGSLLLLGLHVNGQLVGLPAGIRTQLWRFLACRQIDVVQSGRNASLPSAQKEREEGAIAILTYIHMYFGAAVINIILDLTCLVTTVINVLLH